MLFLAHVGEGTHCLIFVLFFFGEASGWLGKRRPVFFCFRPRLSGGGSSMKQPIVEPLRNKSKQHLEKSFGSHDFISPLLVLLLGTFVSCIFDTFQLGKV